MGKIHAEQATFVIAIIILSVLVSGCIQQGNIPANVSNTAISGIVAENSVWSGNISVTGDVTVLPAVTLTILPGTVITVTAFSDDQHGGVNHPHDPPFPNDPDRLETQSTMIQINGILNATGTPNNRIIFTSDKKQTTYDWDGLYIVHGKLDYAIVEHARYNNIQEASDVIISNSAIRNSLECCLCIGHANPVSPQILNNDIYNCGHEGIDNAGGSPLIKGNHFHQENPEIQPDPSMGGVGYVVYKNAYPIIEDNVFDKNSRAIYFNPNALHAEEPEKRAVIRNNIIKNNDAVFDIDSGFPINAVVMENNTMINNTEEKNEESAQVSEALSNAKRVENVSISGKFHENQIWSGEILVTGDTHIDGDLTIMPGTVVKFAVKDDIGWGNGVDADGYNDLDPTRLESYEITHSDLVVNGKLLAQGTPDNMIRFTSVASEPNYADWVGIHVGADNSIMEYCIVEWARHGISLGHNTPNTIIRNNIINYTFWGSISSGSSSAQIYNNEIWEAGHEGIDVQGGNPVIENNTIHNVHTGIVVLAGSAVIRNNTMINVGDGIHKEAGATPVLENNHIELASSDSAMKWSYGNFSYMVFGDAVVRG